MKIDAFAHILPPNYAERVFELLRARGDTSAAQYEGMAGRLKTLQATLDNEEVAARLRRPLLDYLKRFYADTANFGNPIALRAALDFFGPDHVLFGTDFGFSMKFAPETIDDVESVVEDEEVKRKVYEDNARRVLRLEEAALVD